MPVLVSAICAVLRRNHRTLARLPARDREFASHGDELAGAGGTQLPDVLVDVAGVRIATEAKFEAPGAGSAVTAQLHERLETGLAMIAVGVIYPASKREAPNVSEALDDAVLRVRFAAIGRLECVQRLFRRCAAARLELTAARTPKIMAP
jgi:hypothetical protein